MWNWATHPTRNRFPRRTSSYDSMRILNRIKRNIIGTKTSFVVESGFIEKKSEGLSGENLIYQNLIWIFI
jgi:hypothetical protein